ncbi:MAG TPA: hypothetical protein VFD58_01310 [Blastocatellia bacterium]|nr:hypothetical protein [Blastocatellia bacterium]
MTRLKHGSSLVYGGLLLALLAVCCPAQTVGGSSSIAGAELSGACPADCQITGTISNIVSRQTADGREIDVSWQISNVPGDLKLKNVSVIVKVQLESGKTLDGSLFVGTALGGQTTIPVKGGFLGLNKGRREKATAITAKLAAFADLKNPNSPAINVLSTKVNGEKGDHVDVLWEVGPISPCDTTTGFEVEVEAETRLGTTLHGSVTKPRNFRLATVSLKGLGRRVTSELKNIRATVKFAGRTGTICVTSKTIPVAE